MTQQVRILRCGFCGGSGYNYVGLEKQLCPSCKGLGMVYPKRISPRNAAPVSTPTQGTLARPSKFEYDVAISFAGEDRAIVRPYADALVAEGLNVFYDEYEQVSLWGEDLYTRFDDVYRNKARYCVLFISVHYASKLWANHERRSAQARAFRENKPYLLPVKLDDTEIPGLRETVGYIDLRKISLSEIVTLTLKKVTG